MSDAWSNGDRDRSMPSDFGHNSDRICCEMLPKEDAARTRYRVFGRPHEDSSLRARGAGSLTPRPGTYWRSDCQRGTVRKSEHAEIRREASVYITSHEEMYALGKDRGKVYRSQPRHVHSGTNGLLVPMCLQIRQCLSRATQ